MAVSDIASLVVRRVFDEMNTVPEIARSIEDSPASEPGPPTGVRPFSGADASAAALAAKIGARVFQRARERKVANDRLNKQALDEQYRQAQIAHLTNAVSPAPVDRSRKVTLRDGRTIEGLTPAEQLGYERDVQNDPAPEAMIEIDPDTGKKLPFPMKHSEWLQLRGQNLASERAARIIRLARERMNRGPGGGKAPKAFIPTETEVYNRVQQDAARAVDAQNPKLDPKKRNLEISKLAAKLYEGAMARRDSTIQANGPDAPVADPLIESLREVFANPD